MGDIKWFIERVVDALTVYEAARKELRCSIYDMLEAVNEIYTEPHAGGGRK